MSIFFRWPWWPRRPLSRKKRLPARRRPAFEELEGRDLLAASPSFPLLLDLGTDTSDGAPGYVQAPLAEYTPASGFGWENLTAIRSVGRGGDPLTSDLNYTSREGTFLVDLPDGTYDVTTVMGDPRNAFDRVDVWAEGRQVADGLEAARGEVLRTTFRVAIGDGQLTLRLADPGGSSRFIPLSGLEVRTVSEAPGPVVNIDAAWLSQRGPGPYVLDRPETTYVLQTDVTTEGTAFVVGAAGVVFDLNGHTVTYGNSAPLSVANGGFERGSGRSVPGWDLSDAPTASLAANTSYLFGNRVLRLSSFRTAQRIVSDPINIPKADRTYAATITPANPVAHATLTLSVIDAVTGQVLASGTSANASNGFSAVAEFIPTTTRAVRLRIDVTPPAGRADSLDLDQATLTVSHDYGILASDASNADVPGSANLPAAAKDAYRDAADFTIKNGKIYQGTADGYSSDPLYFRRLDGFTVESVETLTTGTDTETLEATYATVRATVRNSTFRSDIDNVTARTHNLATLRLNNVTAPIVVEGNRLLGSPQVGIMLARGDPRFSVTIRDNEFRQKAVVTNGYAILLSAVEHFEISGNTILPESGKGISLDGYTSDLLGDGTIHDNYVDVKETPNREYPAGLDAVALRLRNNLSGRGPHRDLDIRDNTFIARSGPGLVDQAYAVRISYVNKDGAMDDAGIVLEDNAIIAVAASADPTYRATALVLDRVDAGINLRIAGNVLESNDVSLALTDTGGGVAGVELVSNTFRLSDRGPARQYAAVLAGYYNRTITDVRLIEPVLANGAAFHIDWAGSGEKDLSVVWPVDVLVRDAAGNPVAGAAVSIREKTGARVFSGTTGVNGRVDGVPVVAIIYRQTTSDPFRINVDKRGPHTISATFDGDTVSRQVDLTGSLELVLIL